MIRVGIEGGMIPEKKVTCIVFDEAHRATGNYAYCRIVRHMETANVGYRIVALSATPGSNEDTIQQVLTNLCISKIEARDETDADVKQYTHVRNVDIVQIRKTDTLARLERLAKGVALIPQEFLMHHHLLPAIAHRLHGKTLILEWLAKFKETCAAFETAHGKQKLWMAFASFSCLLSLVSGYGMLLTHDQLSASFSSHCIPPFN